MKEKFRIAIFWLGTSVYKEYFLKFAYTLENLFPDAEKELYIMSDGFEDYDGKIKFGCLCHHIEVIDFPYPLVTANKLQMVSHYIKKYKIEYAMYFDSDTLILEKPKEFWANLEEKIKSGKMLCSEHPHYLYTPDRNFDAPFIVQDPECAGYVDYDIFNWHRAYIMTSFFAGTADAFHNYGEKVYKMLGKNLSTIRWMPQWPDEAYFNGIYYDECIIGREDTILKEKYITINPYPFGDFPERAKCGIYTNNFPEYDDTIFLNQKYDLDIKDKKKSNSV